MKIVLLITLIFVLAGCVSVRQLSQEELRSLLGGGGNTVTLEGRGSSGPAKGSVVGPWVNPGDPKVGRRRF